MNETFTRCVLAAFLLCFFPLSRGNSQQGFRDPFEPQFPRRAVIFFGGVNGCKPSSAPEREHHWEDQIQHMTGGAAPTLESESGEFAKPFSTMATSEMSSEQLMQLDDYIRSCRDEGKAPLFVFAPRLNIEGYLATIIRPEMPHDTLATFLHRITAGIFPLTPRAHAEKTRREDEEWIRETASAVLLRLNKAGYEIDAYAHSWGVELATKGIQAAGAEDEGTEVTLRLLVSMNGRATQDSLEALEKDGLVNTVIRITTSGDALTYPGKAAFGKPDGGFFIAGADVAGWNNLNLVKQMTIRHNIPLESGSTRVIVERDGEEYEMTLSEFFFYSHPSRSEGHFPEVSQQVKNQPSVRSTETVGEDGNPVTGIEAGPVVSRMLVPALMGQMRWRLGSALNMRDVLPTVGPHGTNRVGPLSVNQVLTEGNAVEAVAYEFREGRHFTSTKAVTLVMKTHPEAYQHDYPICPRFHLNFLNDLAAIPLSLTDSGDEGAWFWFSNILDNHLENVEVGCHFAVFVNEADRSLVVDSRWVDKQYSPYWRSPQAPSYDYILNFQLWSYNAEETMKLLDAVLRRLERLSGWDVRYANQQQPTLPIVFVEEAWLSGNTVHLSVWNRSWLPTMACFHGTKQSVPGGRDQFFEAWQPVHPGRNHLQLSLGSIDNAVIHCETHGFMDKVFVSRANTRAAARVEATLESDAHISTDTAKRPSIHIIWPPPDATVVTLQDHLDTPFPRNDEGKKVAIAGICPGAPEGSRVVVQVHTDRWYRHQGRQPEMKDGVWGVRAYLSGEGEHNKHWIHAALYDRYGNKLAEDRVGPIYRVTPLPDDATARVDRQGVGEPVAERLADQQQEFPPITVETAKFRVGGTARFTDGSIVIGGGPDGPHARGGTAVCRVNLPQDASRTALEISLWHGTPGQLGHGIHGKVQGGKAIVFINDVPVHTIVCRHRHMYGDWWPEPTPELGRTLPTVDLREHGIRGESVEIKIQVDPHTCMNLKSIDIKPILR